MMFDSAASASQRLERSFGRGEHTQTLMLSPVIQNDDVVDSYARGAALPVPGPPVSDGARTRGRAGGRGAGVPAPAAAGCKTASVAGCKTAIVTVISVVIRALSSVAGCKTAIITIFIVVVRALASVAVCARCRRGAGSREDSLRER